MTPEQQALAETKAKQFDIDYCNGEVDTPGRLGPYGGSFFKGIEAARANHKLIEDLLRERAQKALADEWKDIHEFKPTLHWCAEFDGLLIDKHDSEFSVCTCIPGARIDGGQ